MESTITPLVIGTIAGFFLLAMLTMTAFIKLSVVLMIVRQALGLQQVPSNMIIMALSVFLAIFISYPVMGDSISAFMGMDISVRTPQDFINLWTAGSAPFREFITRNSDPVYSDFFVEVSQDVWRGSGYEAVSSDFVIQIPTFMVSELTEAFRIGSLLYLPFIAIDIAITAILMALGMQMMQPNIISVPFKLLTFVFVDGWSRIGEGLILSYGAIDGL
jgi:type III secretion protein R